MLRKTLAALLLTLGTLVPVHADIQILNDPLGEIGAVIAELRDRTSALGPWCQTSPRLLLYDLDTAPVQATVPRVVANAFAPDGSSEALSFLVHTPTHLVPSCPHGAVEPVSQIRLLPDGSFQGVVESTNISFNSHFFITEIAFTADHIHDWEFLVPGTATTQPALYGAYRLRNLRPRADDTSPPGYSPDILPPDWN